jgi:hypothetical protein
MSSSMRSAMPRLDSSRPLVVQAAASAAAATAQT